MIKRRGVLEEKRSSWCGRGPVRRPLPRKGSARPVSCHSGNASPGSGAENTALNVRQVHRLHVRGQKNLRQPLNGQLM